MAEEITPEVFAHLVTLAALELAPEEGEYLRKQLNNQLKAVHELESIPLSDDTPIASHGVPYTRQTSSTEREDVHTQYADVASLLACAPLVAGDYIIVPEIPHQALK